MGSFARGRKGDIRLIFSRNEMDALIGLFPSMAVPPAGPSFFLRGRSGPQSESRTRTEPSSRRISTGLPEAGRWSNRTPPGSASLFIPGGFWHKQPGKTQPRHQPPADAVEVARPIPPGQAVVQLGDEGNSRCCHSATELSSASLCMAIFASSNRPGPAGVGVGWRRRLPAYRWIPCW